MVILNKFSCMQLIHIVIDSYPDLKLQHTLNAHPANCICIEFDPKGKYFATGSADALVSIWDVAELACIRTLSRYFKIVVHNKFTFKIHYTSLVHYVAQKLHMYTKKGLKNYSENFMFLVLRCYLRSTTCTMFLYIYVLIIFIKFKAF